MLQSSCKASYFCRKKEERVYETLDFGSPEATRIASEKRGNSINSRLSVGSPEEIRIQLNMKKVIFKFNPLESVYHISKSQF